MSAVTGINSCLQAIQLYDYLLPVIGQSDAEVVDMTSSDNNVVESNGVVKSVTL